MRIVRLASLMLVAMLAVGLAVVSVASAEAPMFKPTGASLTGTSSTAKLSAGGLEVVCASDTSTSGTSVTTLTLIGGITVHFLECTGKNPLTKESCPVDSPLAPLTNLILTTTLHGVLGLILPKPTSGSDVALVLLPVSGKTFVTLSGKCVPGGAAAVSGLVAGLVTPVNTSTTKGLLTFSQSGGVQAIKEVDVSNGGLVKPKLNVGAETATEETVEEVTWSEPTEVC